MRADENDVLRRFHRTLVRELRGREDSDLSAPVTVAEIYRDLVPQRILGDELGLATNPEYEYVLLRLLAGEGDYLTVGSREAVEDIRDELRSPSPDTGLYREFARVQVHLNSSRMD